MHLPLTINQVKHVNDPPWSSFRVIAERNIHQNPNEETVQKYDLLLLDTKQFGVQPISENKSQKLYSQFDVLNILKDDVVHVFPSNDKTQTSTGKFIIWCQ